MKNYPALLLTIDQAAALLALSSATLRNWRNRHAEGLFLEPEVRRFVESFVRVGGAVRVPGAAVEAFARGGQP